MNWTQDKHILITGASSGIGLHMAIYLAKKCRRLTLVSRNKDHELERLKASLANEKAAIHIYAADLRDAQSASRIINEIYEEGEQVDAFINSAGGSHVLTEFENMTKEDINVIFDINAKAPIFWLRELLPRMKYNQSAKNQQKKAQVVFLSSRSGERSLSHLSIYTIAKGAVEKLAEVLRNEYARFGIAFTLINPGSINTNFTKNWQDNAVESHNEESMSVEESIQPIIHALEAPYSINKVSYQSVEQWKNEPGVLKLSSI